MKSKIIPVLILVWTGCSLAPRYSRPPMPAPKEWSAAVPDDGKPAELAPSVTDWRKVFTDPGMQSVIERALNNNRSLRVAALKVERAAAMYHIQKSELNPGLGVAASSQRYRIPEKMSSNNEATIYSEYSVGVGIPTWEIDFFGRLRSLKNAALNQYLATDNARAATEISLVSAVAGSYLMLAADRELLELARSTLGSNEASYDMIVKSRDLGIATDLDANQARSLVESARAEVARLSGSVQTDQNMLSLIVGDSIEPGILPGGLNAVEPIAELHPGLPSDVLLSRPDIMAAEHLLMAANANIGAARAAFFPRVSLTAAFGTLGPDIASLFDAGTRTWNFAPQIIAPIFASGALRANLAATRASREIAVAEYEGAIQQAFSEVSNALVESEALAGERTAVEGLVTALEESHRLAVARYDAGFDSYLQVLVAERSLFSARQRLVGLRLAEQANRVTLFKVIGG